MFILRNLQPVAGTDRYTGEREIVSIEQVVAAEGPREPSAARAQKVFNVGFVYVTTPGQTPDPDSIGLQRQLRDKIIEHWSHITGGRSQMTTTVPSIVNRSPLAVGALPNLTVHADGAAVVNVSRAFRDPDEDLLTYRATSSTPGVASVAVSGSVLTVTPVSAGTATVTVTATDADGSNTSASHRLTACVRYSILPATSLPRYQETWEASEVGDAPDPICNGTRRFTFTDHPVRPGMTPVKAVHFLELRQRIDALRVEAGLGRIPWTDAVLTVGATPVKLVHLLELRSALAAPHAVVGRAAPGWTDAAPMARTTPTRATHLMELRAAVVALE